MCAAQALSEFYKLLKLPVHKGASLNTEALLKVPFFLPTQTEQGRVIPTYTLGWAAPAGVTHTQRAALIQEMELLTDFKFVIGTHKHLVRSRCSINHNCYFGRWEHFLGVHRNTTLCFCQEADHLAP